ncbi:hypothetical protein CEE37_01165 [candidate division LCP-89 bacterium B3_LCP]|uniref:BACON domain-containing protein n=1 Tax=candidate division LCP-89 bacterium B3_LCP TaxID=2012998 RepID=A0A532V547_UNCL8|nr:MAG: hypothetical protein CEE37_01165 [candidate division LCP-89 bacterium B3_LCP]
MKTTNLITAILSFILTCFLVGCIGSSVDESIGPSDDPLIGVSQNSIDFGIAGSQRTLIIYNAGGGILSWTISSYPGWVDPQVNTGSLSASQSDTVVIDLVRASLAIGSNEDDLLLTSNGGDIVVELHAELSADPVLGELPPSIDFGAFADSVELSIVNAGQGTLEWTVEILEPWITASEDSGSTVLTSSIWLILDRENAPTGEIETLLTIDTGNDETDVMLTAYNGDVSPQWLSYCGNPAYYYQAQPEDYFFIVRFDRPEGWEGYKISKVRIKLHTLVGAYDEIYLLCWAVESYLGGLWPDITDAGTIYQVESLDPIYGWNEWNVDWPLNLDFFCVGYYQADWTYDINPDPFYDGSYIYARSYVMYEDYPGFFTLQYLNNMEWAIEVFVEPVDILAGWSIYGGRWISPDSIYPNAITPPEAPLRSFNADEVSFSKPHTHQ